MALAMTVLPPVLVPTEPAYLTNRAAASIAVKRFHSALADCRLAVTLQAAASASGAAPPKTLLRLARCQLALAQTAAALSTLRAVLAAEPDSALAAQMHARALELEAHIRNLVASRQRREWGMARIALDRCLQAVEAEGSEIPTEWRQWRVELELARGNWDGANSAAKWVPSHPFFFFAHFFFSFVLLPVLCLYSYPGRPDSAMPCGCNQTRPTCSRSVGLFSSSAGDSRMHCSTLNPRFDTTPVTSPHSVCASG